METADGRLRYGIRRITLFVWTVVCLLFACGCSGSDAPERGVTVKSPETLSELRTAERTGARQLTASAACNAEKDRSRRFADRTAFQQASAAISVQPQTDCIRFQPVFEIDIQESDMTGALEYSNRNTSTLDIVTYPDRHGPEQHGICFHPAVVRTFQFLFGPDPATDQVIPRPDQFRIADAQQDHNLEKCALTALPNGVWLAEGDYLMVLRVDAYQPLTGERSAVSAANETVVRIHA